MSDDRRSRIATQQAQLLQSLVEGTPAPEGFDEQRVQICGRTLKNKRLKTILRLHPWISPLLADKLQEEFQTYLDLHPAIPEDGGGADARQFIAHLDSRGHIHKPTLWERIKARVRE